jgi:WD40 repeat protein
MQLQTSDVQRAVYDLPRNLQHYFTGPKAGIMFGYEGKKIVSIDNHHVVTVSFADGTRKVFTAKTGILGWTESDG